MDLLLVHLDRVRNEIRAEIETLDRDADELTDRDAALRVELHLKVALTKLDETRAEIAERR
jgi:hypothetical protein